MVDNSADFVTVLSSDMIAEIVEAYFNKTMYKKQVKVVDLQPQGTGYAFSLAFVVVSDTTKPQVALMPQVALNTEEAARFLEQVRNGVAVHDIMLGAVGNETDVLSVTQRDNKGRFVKHEVNN